MTAHRLSAVESMFVRLGTREVPFVFSCVLELERPIDLEALRERIAAAVADHPRYRQRVQRGLLHDAWVDAPFRIEQHVRRAAVTAPGGRRDLDELAAQLISTDLPDHESPWRMWVVEGLAGGRGAVIAVVHHALADGISGFRLLEELAGTPVAPPPLTSAPRAPAARRTPRLAALAQLLRDGLVAASDVGLNPRRTSASRVVASLDLDLASCRAVQEQFAVTLNDVVLATVSGALRAYLREHGVRSSALADVRAMVPVSQHVAGERDTHGNRVALLTVALPVDTGHPLERLDRVHIETRRLKSTGVAAGGALLVELAEATTPALLAGVLRGALWRRAFNLIVTNVPGPRAPLRLLGVEVTRIVPIVNLWPHQSLGIAAATYGDDLTISVHGDFAVIADPDILTLRLRQAFDELREAAAGRAATVRFWDDRSQHRPHRHRFRS